MHIYNSHTHAKQPLVPVEPGVARIYCCGPTVYNYIHIGNARPAVIFDTLRRFLESQGLRVIFVQNFTDIDDKMIRRAEEENTTVAELGERYIAAYLEDARALGIRPATVHPRATQHMDEMIALIARLIDEDLAYESNGDVYYNTQNFPDYGKLSGQDMEDLAAGARIAVGETKRHPMDFALWKAQKPGEPAWASPWGNGRPGWHIECSAMSMKYLGETMDIHAGGEDLLFPHHENEVAQSVGATGKPFANAWMHNGFLQFDNKKMSKSEGNFFTVHDLLTLHSGEAIRFFLLGAHYRSPLQFSENQLQQARSALDRLYNCRNNLRHHQAHAGQGTQQAADDAGPVVQQSVGDANQAQAVQPSADAANQAQSVRPTANDANQVVRQAISDAAADARKAFVAAMDDDLNTAGAIGVLFDYVNRTNLALADEAAPMRASECALALDTLAYFGNILGLLQEGEDALDEEIEALLLQRKTAREQRDFAKSDALRETLRQRGYAVEDTKQGQKLTRVDG